MNIFFREMKAHRKALIIWCISIILLVISGMGKFEAYSAQNMNQLLAKMPKSLMAIFGMSSLDVSKISGYYGMLFIYLALMATIHAAMLGANIISKEERDKTAEFLMAKPVSRNKIIASKLMAALLNIIIFNITTLVSSLLMVGYYSKGEDNTGNVAILMLGMFILQLIFLFIGTGMASLSKNPKLATTIATTILLVTYILSVVIDLNSKLKNLKYLTPFKYYEAKNLMYGGGLDPVFVTLSVVIIAAMLSVTYVFYKKRDLNV